MKQAEGLVREETRRIKPAQCSPHLGNIMVFALARNHPGSEIQKFLEAVEIGCGSRSVYNETKSDMRYHQESGDFGKDFGWEEVAYIGEAD